MKKPPGSSDSEDNFFFKSHSEPLYLSGSLSVLSLPKVTHGLCIQRERWAWDPALKYSQDKRSSAMLTYRYSPSVDIFTKKDEILHFLQKWEEEAVCLVLINIFLLKRDFLERKKLRLMRQQTKLCSFTYVHIHKCFLIH